VIDFIASFGFTPVEWILVMVAAGLIGANKTGMVSISLISIPILAAVFGGRVSTGVMLPMLILADVIAVISYRKSILWKELAGIFPWALAGIGIALWIGSFVPDEVFKILIASAVIIVLAFLVIKEFTGRNITVGNRWYANAAIGLLGGFSTMIGNAAGPIMSVYFLSLNLNKNQFISTRAWFFWLINLAKLPLHIFVWKTVSLHTFGFDLIMLPAIAVGAVGGLFLVKHIPEKPYRIFVIIATLVSSVFLLI
jgi:uncharacterized membrane protein YfcA